VPKPTIANFSAGPAALPEWVDQQLLLAGRDFHGTGIPVWSISHRHPKFDKMMDDIIGLVRQLLEVPPGYSIALVPGGATTQFKAWVLNMPYIPGPHIGYVDSGHWSRQALAAGRELEDADLCSSMVVASTEADGYRSMPDLQGDIVGRTANVDFVHLVSNETVNGTQMQAFPTSGWGLRPPVVADMSSDLFSRPIPIQAFGYIYAGAQKNFGASGVTLVIVRDELVHDKNLVYPASLDLREQIRVKNGLRNTPATFALASVYYMLKWIKREGGVTEMDRRARERANVLYNTIDESHAFETVVEPSHRSMMNVTFRLRDRAQQANFLHMCEARNIVGIKGHVAADVHYGPHLRASLYNGQTLDAVQRLIDAIHAFDHLHN
jgi:phosphoserine aminotransferase